jgi:hypothetical protein
MDRYHIRLKLTEHPLRESFVFPTHKNPVAHQLFAPKQILNDTVLDQFGSLGLKPAFVVLFHKKPGSVGIVHTDCRFDRAKREWVKWSSAINWNLSGATSTMKFYACSLKEVWPPEGNEEKESLAQLDGIHFGTRNNASIKDSDLQLLATARIAGPTLVRTNTAHTVSNIDDKTVRWCISVRFDPDFADWDSAVRAFRPLIDEGPDEHRSP